MTGSVGSQLITTTSTTPACALNSGTVTPGETLTYSWKVTVNQGTAQYAIYDATTGSIGDSTSPPNPPTVRTQP